MVNLQTMDVNVNRHKLFSKKEKIIDPFIQKGQTLKLQQLS